VREVSIREAVPAGSSTGTGSGTGVGQDAGSIRQIAQWLKTGRP